MTKPLVIISITVGVILVTGVILSLVAPKKVSVRSSRFIIASKQSVFDQIAFMKNFPEWSPFRRQDPEQKYAVSGPDGQVGATFTWEGVKEKSKGSQRITALSGNDKVFIQCSITEPFKSNPTFTYSLVEKNGGVEVVQQFEALMPFPTNVFGMLFGLENKIASTKQQGLELLKKKAEQNKAVLL